MDFVLLLLVVPAATAVAVVVLGPRQALAIRWLSLGATLLCLAVAVALVVAFMEVRAAPGESAPSAERFRPEFVPGADPDHPHQTTWRLISFGNLGAVQFYLGVDGLNIWLIALTAILMVSSVLISWHSIQERVHEFHAWLLLLATGMFGVFLAFDVILFYVFFELTLVPLFFLIGIWGGPERRHAARKFFIFTFAGGVITFLGILAIVTACYQKSGQNQEARSEKSPRNEKRLTFAIPELAAQVNGHLKREHEKLKTASRELAKLPKAQRQGEEDEPDDPRKPFEEQIEVARAEKAYWHRLQFWVFLLLMVGFAIKVPLVPVHTWLPLAHTEAPTAGSVLLAGVLLKIGAYGFLRFCLPLTPDACLSLGLPLIGTLAVIGIVYGAFCSLAQDDIKKLVAYSSVSHLGFCMLGMFALNQAGLTGSLLQMINHGLSTGALFLLVGMLYERYHTRRISEFGGLGAKLGLLAFCMVFISLSSIGLPGLNGFVGEALVFFGMFAVDPALAVVGTAGIVLGAWYLLNVLKRVFFGPLKEPHVGQAFQPAAAPVSDMTAREWFAVGPIMLLCLLLGLFPQPVIDTAARDLRVVEQFQQSARKRAQEVVEQVPGASPTSEDSRAAREGNER